MSVNNKNNILVVVIISVVFGLIAGVVGEFVARAYIFENSFNIPLFGDISYSGSRSGGSSIIISGAKKVVVEQNTKVAETAESVKSSMVAIYNKNLLKTTEGKSGAKTEKEPAFNIENYYQVNNEAAQGFIITSDGWIISDFIPAELIAINKEFDQIATSTKKAILNNYIIFTKEKKEYDVDDIMFDLNSAYAFWHVEAIDLPVRKFAFANEITNGQLVMSVNSHGGVLLTTITSQSQNEAELVHSSDKFTHNIMLAQNPSKDFYGSFLFNLSGDLVALLNEQGELEPVDNLAPIINSLLNGEKVKWPSLGVNYIDLSSLISIEPGQRDKGALIYKNKDGVAVVKDSPANLAGLREGDIIISVDNTDLNKDNTLNSIIRKHTAGEKINVVYSRGNESKEVEVTLGELK